MNITIREIEISNLLDQELTGDTKRINDFFIKLFNGLEEYTSDNLRKLYPKSIFYVKHINGEKVICIEEDLKNEKMWLSYEHIWSFFETEFGYNYNQIKELTHYMLELNMKRKVFPTFSD